MQALQIHVLSFNSNGTNAVNAFGITKVAHQQLLFALHRLSFKQNGQALSFIICIFLPFSTTIFYRKVLYC